MVTTNGPLQQTFVRFCVDPINPRHNITARLFLIGVATTTPNMMPSTMEKNWGEGGDCEIYKTSLKNVYILIVL